MNQFKTRGPQSESKKMKRSVLLLLAGIAFGFSMAAGSIAKAHPILWRPHYVIIPFIDLSPNEQRIFLRRIMPGLTLGGDLTNAGNRRNPWYCIAFRSAKEASDFKAAIGFLWGAPSIERQAIIERTCAAG